MTFPFLPWSRMTNRESIRCEWTAFRGGCENGAAVGKVLCGEALNPDDMLPALYSGARAFMYPLLYEGFGLPPPEAMACGAPVIVSRSSSLPEVVGDAGIQIAALDVDALGEAMGRLIEDDALRLSLGKKGIQRAARFGWQKCADRAAAVYRRVLS